MSCKVLPKLVYGKIVGWLEVFTHPIFDDENETIVGVAEFLHDVTERKNMEDAIKNSELKLKEAQQIAKMDSV